MGQQAVRGRGRYAGRIVKRKKPPSAQEVSRYTAQTAARTVSANIDKLQESEDLESQLERMIFEEMMCSQQPRACVKGRPKTNDTELYEEKETPEYDQFSEVDAETESDFE